MSQKIAVVTGASGGLGSHLCMFIAGQGVGLILIDRDPRKSQTLATALNARYPAIVKQSLAVDLASHQDIRRATSDILQRYSRIDYLFNNAGVLTETLQFSEEQNELHFEVNTLAPLQLIDQLRPALQAANGAMVVNTSAGLALGAKTLDWNELLKPTTFKKLYGSYVNSKEALNVLTSALATDMKQDGVTLRAADPGPNQTGLTKGKGTPLWMRLFYRFLPGPEKGAKKIFDAGFSDQYGTLTGVFISGGKVKPLPPALTPPAFQADFLSKCRARAAMMK